MELYLPKLPDEIRSFALALGLPVALVGCRCGESSLECCEYDLAIFDAGNTQSNLVKVEGYFIEEHHFDFSSIGASPLLDTSDAIVIRDSPSMQLSSKFNDTEHSLASRRLLQSLGRRSLVRSLFCQGEALEAYKESDTQAAAMWLKIGAFAYSRGTLEIAGTRPMPLHELGQLRNQSSSPIDHSGLDLATEIIGLERASRSVLSRSIPSARALLDGRPDLELIMAKASTLLQKQMIADCYYYIGMQVCSHLFSGAGVLKAGHMNRQNFNMKLVETALDLSIDASTFRKNQSGLFRAATIALRGLKKNN